MMNEILYASGCIEGLKLIVAENVTMVADKLCGTAIPSDVALTLVGLVGFIIIVVLMLNPIGKNLG